MKNLTSCGECPFFKYEDSEGWGICDIFGCTLQCGNPCIASVRKDSLELLSDDGAIRVLHHYEKWRKGAKIKQPNSKIVSAAIDYAIKSLRTIKKNKNEI